ncbi:ABC transporter ATP-binding protein [Rothia nasimurium]|uniref:ABC transporter ATP-binding protein n=1 Tax=Rothia nasimurium TaxID=85336 RepID=UPI001F001D0B|nr:ATP-binding cassette domain-containing protein [Rothia nasimurium]
MDSTNKNLPHKAIARFENVSKNYGSTVALSNISFDLNPGEVVGLLGANGAGKTTLMRILLGLVRPSSGHVRVLDELPGSQRSLQKIGATIESPAFMPGMTGRDCLTMAALAKSINPNSVDFTLKRVGLTSAADRKFKTYSMGMKQRLAVAQALLGDPELLIIDEPMNGLDPQGVKEMRDLIDNIVSEDRTVLISSHQLNEIQLMCSRIIVLNEGRKLADETLDKHSTNLEQYFFDLLARDLEKNQ